MSEHINVGSKVPVLEQCRDILINQIRAAVDQLGEHTGSTQVHDARKALKQARATLRLMRPALTGGQYRHMNAVLRDAAQPLSNVRDADVLITSLQKILRKFGEPGRHVDISNVERYLAQQRGRAERGLTAKRVDTLRSPLRAAQAQTSNWRLRATNSSVVFDALRHSYSRVRKAHRIARKEASTESLHEWRKRTKYLWHQVQLLAPPSSREMHEYADAMHRLSDHLGDDHDLAVLRSSIFGSRKLLEKKSEDALKAFIDRRRAKLQSKAFASAVGLLEESPKAWCRQLKRRVKHAARGATKPARRTGRD